MVLRMRAESRPEGAVKAELLATCRCAWCRCEPSKMQPWCDGSHAS
jgi:CDGSH-type Zn-finger protein